MTPSNDNAFDRKEDFLDYLSFLEELCSKSYFRVTMGLSEKIRIEASALMTTIGIVDVWRFQAQANWNNGESYSAQIGQGLFSRQDNIITVNGRADRGWKYYLPDPQVFHCVKPEPTLTPTLKELVQFTRTAENVTSRFAWAWDDR